MVKIGGKENKICLLDTKAISFILEDEQRFNILSERYPFSEYVYSFSPYTLYELNKNKVLLNTFIDTFSNFPCMLMKNEKELFEEEIKKHQQSVYKIQPWLTNFSAIKAHNKGNKTIAKLFDIADMETKFNSLEKTINETFLTMLEWRKWALQYPCKSAIMQYRIIEAFAVSRIKYFNPDFYASKRGKIKFKDYPSIRLLGYGWFYKFVPDKKRIVKINDVEDILNISALPYCDVFIGEANLCDIISKIKTQEFLNGVEVQKTSILLENRHEYQEN